MEPWFISLVLGLSAIGGVFFALLHGGNWLYENSPDWLQGALVNGLWVAWVAFLVYVAAANS